MLLCVVCVGQELSSESAVTVGCFTTLWTCPQAVGLKQSLLKRVLLPATRRLFSPASTLKTHLCTPLPPAMSSKQGKQRRMLLIDVDCWMKDSAAGILWSRAQIWDQMWRLAVYITACQLENMANIWSFQTTDSILKHFKIQSCNKCCILNIGGEYIWLESCNFMIEGIKNCFLVNSKFPLDFLVGTVLKVAWQSSGADLSWPGHCSSQQGSPHCSSQTYQDELLIHLWVLVLTLEWPSR